MDLLDAACEALLIDRADVIAHRITPQSVTIVVRQGQKFSVDVSRLKISPPAPGSAAISTAESIVAVSDAPSAPVNSPIEPAQPPRPRKGRRAV